MRQNVIDGLVLQLRAISAGFGTASAGKGTAVAYDHRVLSKGVDRAAIVLADSFEVERQAMADVQDVHWRLSVGLFVRHKNDVVAARRSADTWGGSIVERIRANPTLGGSAYDTVVESGQVDDENFSFGGQKFLLETITVRATEELGL